MMLENRVVFVSGASRGIGAATAKLLAHHGARVAVNYHSNDAAARDVVESIHQHRGVAMGVRGDITNEKDVHEMVDAVTRTYGPIDTLVLNAGMRVHVAPYLGYPWEHFERKLLGECQGVFHISQAVLPSMIQHKRGCIVVVSSGLSRHPSQGFSAHSASKSALDSLVRSMAYELGVYGIRVNTIAPGLVNTDATAFLPKEAKQSVAQWCALKKVGEPDDIAGAIFMMVSDATRHITGAYIPVDGGHVML